MVKHRICHGFWCSPKNSSKWSQKIHFLAHFRRFFTYALLRPMSHASIFCQIEGLKKIPNCGKFHEYSICGCQVINFQSVLYQFSIHQMVPFGGFLDPIPSSPPPPLPKGNIQGEKKCVLRIFEKFKYMRKREIPKVCTFGPTLTPRFSLKIAEKL